MHIVIATPECAPLVKTGGMGEVLGALPSAIARLGHRVTIYVPYYRAVRIGLENQPDASVPPLVLQSLTIPFPDANRFVRVLDGGTRDGVETYLVDCPEMFDREGVYGPPGKNYADNAVRYGLYCRAVLEAAKLLGVPDVFHLHDWQAALLAVLLHTTYAADPMLAGAATVFTIHNGGYQGSFPREQLRDLLLPAWLDASGAMGTPEGVNPFLGALRYSDRVTTVSSGYAQELMTPEYSEGLDVVYRERADAFGGILNGIDTTLWNPRRDPYLAAHFSAEDLGGKRECRRDLLHAFGAGTTGEDVAVIGIVSRLAAQKGFDLIAEAMPKLAQMNVLLLIVGQGEPEVEEQFAELARQYCSHLHLSCDFHEAIAHKMQAGADMTLMPSRYEPSGLTQMYSLRYGTIPVVRATGGLRDTVYEGPQGNGFVFEDYTHEALVGAVRRACAAFSDRPAWQARMRRCMEQDLRWDKPAQEYISVYEQAVTEHRAKPDGKAATELVGLAL